MIHNSNFNIKYKNITMSWGLFNKKEKSDDQLNKEFRLKIETALKNAQNDKREASNDIEKIKSWAAEAIVEAYADIFPNGHLTYYREKYKDDALAKYEEIKKENAEKIGEKKAEECDKIVRAYMNQIKLRESKMVLYDKLVTNYQNTMNKLTKVEIKAAEDAKVDKHKERLKELDGVEDDFANAMTDTAEMEELVREFELKAEYDKQLKLLNDKYKNESLDDYTTSSAFKDEIDKLVDEID